MLRIGAYLSGAGWVSLLIVHAVDGGWGLDTAADLLIPAMAALGLMSMASAYPKDED